MGKVTKPIHAVKTGPAYQVTTRAISTKENERKSWVGDQIAAVFS